jgi:hypothetical protein
MSDTEDDLYGGLEYEITQDEINIRNKMIMDCCKYSVIYNRNILIDRIKSNIKKLNSHDKFRYWDWFPDY